jgi:hypothetical protein
LIFRSEKILEKRWKFGKYTFGFIDLENAYDNLNRKEIWKVSHRANVSKGLMERIKNIYDTCENSVLVDVKKSGTSKHL